MEPKPFEHPNLDPNIVRRVQEQEILGGADLRKLPVNGILKVTTKNTVYVICRLAEGEEDWPYEISGSPRFCPTPERAYIAGSTWGGTMLKMHYIGRDMHMQFHLKKCPERTYTTTPVRNLEETTND